MEVRIALRLLILQYYQKLGDILKSKRYESEVKKLKDILAPIF